MKSVTLDELLPRLEEHCGAVIVAMTTRTEPPLLKKARNDGRSVDDHFPCGVLKLARGSFMLANRYRDNVRSQRRREGHPRPESFRSGKLWGGAGERLGRFLARHVETGRLYVVARPASDRNGYPVRIWQRWIDLHSGDELAGDRLMDLRRNWMADPPSFSTKQALARQIPYRTYMAPSIHSVTFGGQVYRLIADNPRRLAADGTSAIGATS